MYTFDYHDTMATVIRDNLKGRKLLSLGKSEYFEELLKNKYGIHVFGYLTLHTWAVKDNCCLLNQIKNCSNEYYVIGLVPYSQRIDELLITLGYNYINDWIFKEIRPIVLNNLCLNNTEYHDVFGNIIRGHGTVGKIILRGYNNKIVFAESVEGLNYLLIDIYSDTKIFVGNRTKFVPPSSMIRGISSQESSNNAVHKCGSGTIYIHDGVTVHNASFVIATSGTQLYVSIGSGAYIGQNTKFDIDHGQVIIGEDCIISDNTGIMIKEEPEVVSFGNLVIGDDNAARTLSPKEGIFIGNHVYLGHHTLVLHNSLIEDGSKILAGSVVNSILFNSCEIGGNPAKVISKDRTWLVNTNKSMSCWRYKISSFSVPPITGKNILIFGGTGNMGPGLIKQLYRYGNTITVVNRGMKGNPVDDSLLISHITADLNDGNKMHELFYNKHYDIVFNNIAYNARMVKNVLDNITCDKYVQLSTIGVYTQQHYDLREDEYDSLNYTYGLNLVSDYNTGKRFAENILAHDYPNVCKVIIRLPYVNPYKRLIEICKAIKNNMEIKLNNPDNKFSIVSAQEVVLLLSHIDSLNLNGTYNFASEGELSIIEIIQYIEKKTGISAKYGDEITIPLDSKWVQTFNLSKIRGEGVRLTHINDWFWDYLDEIIQKVWSE